MKKIVIAGASGFLGTFLAHKYSCSGLCVVRISRQNGDVNWNDAAGLENAINGADLIINLAGKSVDCRYNQHNKQEILNSRLSTTKAIGQAISNCRLPPRLWINAGTATIYRHAEDRPMTEAAGEIGEGFSVDVAKQWEKTVFDFKLPHTRQVVLRMAIVLGKEGGVMQPLTRLTRFGFGGKQGKGSQMFSWIHIQDIYQIIEFLAKREDLSGVINCAAPNPVTNSVLMNSIRQNLQVKAGLPCPEWLLKLGAMLIRTEPELVLKSRWVVPEKLLYAGFNFSFPFLQPALEQIIK